MGARSCGCRTPHSPLLGNGRYTGFNYMITHDLIPQAGVLWKRIMKKAIICKTFLHLLGKLAGMYWAKWDGKEEEGVAAEAAEHNEAVLLQRLSKRAAQWGAKVQTHCSGYPESENIWGTVFHLSCFHFLCKTGITPANISELSLRILNK